jgi:hypothetical protein
LLQIVDISDPTKPALNTELSTPNNWLGVAADGGYVYMFGIGEDSKGLIEAVEACIF